MDQKTKEGGRIAGGLYQYPEKNSGRSRKILGGPGAGGREKDKKKKKRTVGIEYGGGEWNG